MDSINVDALFISLFVFGWLLCAGLVWVILSAQRRGRAALATLPGALLFGLLAALLLPILGFRDGRSLALSFPMAALGAWLGSFAVLLAGAMMRRRAQAVADRTDSRLVEPVPDGSVREPEDGRRGREGQITQTRQAASMGKTALSTMWAVKRYEPAQIKEFAEAALRFGFDGIEINYAMPEESVAALVDHGIPVVSMHAPAPLERLPDQSWNNNLNLADIDEDQRQEAVRHHKRTIDWAQRAGARYVVCHMGGIEHDMFDEERRLRKLYDSGVRDGHEVETLRLAARERRAREVRPWFDQSRRSFLELAEYASPKGIALGLENRYHFHEIPDVEETLEMLEEARTEQAGYWHDVGHAEVLGRIGLGEMYRWLRDLEHRTIGMHLHDVKGIGDHQAPGQGDADWDYVKTFIKPETARTFEIGQHNSEEHVAASIPFLKELGIL